MLIPEIQPKQLWHDLLHNQRGMILDRAIRRGTGNVVLCRLRYRLEQLVSDDSAPPAPPEAARRRLPRPRLFRRLR